MMGLKANGWCWAKQRGAVIAPLLQIAIDSWPFQKVARGLKMAAGCLHTVFFQETDGFVGREMMALFIGCPQLQGRHHLTVTLHLVFGHDPGHAVIGSAQGTGTRVPA